ncbi:MAG: uracil-DNA glycosylase [Bacteroidota bacterium]
MSEVRPVINESWRMALEQEFKSLYFIELKTFLVEEKKKYTIFPPGSQIFSAFDYTPFDQVKVVILGQDPYHGSGQANGLCFSVSDGIARPPSLVNIFKELNSDLGIPVPLSGNLEPWAKQGVLLLNATLTVRAGQAGSHQNKGWEVFTDSVIRQLSVQRNRLIFLLWGAYAQAKIKIIDTAKHYVLKASHPSPFSAYSGFMGCKHFSKTNELLKEMGKEEINWALNC